MIKERERERERERESIYKENFYATTTNLAANVVAKHQTIQWNRLLFIVKKETITNTLCDQCTYQNLSQLLMIMIIYIFFSSLKCEIHDWDSFLPHNTMFFLFLLWVHNVLLMKCNVKNLCTCIMFLIIILIFCCMLSSLI